MDRVQTGCCLAAWCLAVGLAAVVLPEARGEEPLGARIKPLVEPYLDAKLVVGMTIGVVDHEHVETFGYGRMSAENASVPDGATIYEIGSMSKVFTGLLLADAVERKVVTLDDPAGELLPGGAKMPVRGERKITLEDLATHRSGLPRLPDNLNPADPTNPYADYTPQLLLEFLAGYKLTREPAKEFEYSNLGMGLLGYLLAEKQNKSYEQLLRERIAAPLKMTDTVIKLDAAQRARLAPPHDGDGRAGKNWDLPTLAGAGAIRSTAADLLRFAQANIKTPEGELGQAIELAWRVHQEPLKGGPFAVGLGWHIARDGSTRWHNGQTGGYHSMLLVRREQQLAVVLLTNSGTGDVDALAEDIMRMLAGATVKPRAIDKPIDVAADVMQSYEGKYELVPGAVFTVAVDGKKLMVGLTGQPAFEVYARSKTEWFYKVVKATLTFKVDGDGKCNAVELFQNGIHKTAKRVE